MDTSTRDSITKWIPRVFPRQFVFFTTIKKERLDSKAKSASTIETTDRAVAQDTTNKTTSIQGSGVVKE